MRGFGSAAFRGVPPRRGTAQIHLPSGGKAARNGPAEAGDSTSPEGSREAAAWQGGDAAMGVMPGMHEDAHKALLPAGLRDLLPPEAGHEARLREALLATLAGHGYELVKPPLIEFEDSLLAGSGVAMAGDTFRMMDPVSQRMMGVRADMTLRIARIA